MQVRARLLDFGDAMGFSMSNAMQATSLLHTILRDRYPTFNIFVDTSADPGGPCRVEMTDGTLIVPVDIFQAEDGALVYTLRDGMKGLRVFITPDKLLSEIAKLVEDK